MEQHNEWPDQFIGPGQRQKLKPGPIRQREDRKIKRPGLTEELHNVAGGQIREIREIREIEIEIKANER